MDYMNELGRARQLAGSVPTPGAGMGGLGAGIEQAQIQNEAAKPTPAARAVMEMEKMTEQVRVLVHELERRVSPVLRPTHGGEGKEGPSQPEPVRSGLVQMLSLHTESLIQIAGHLGSLIDRVEL